MSKKNKKTIFITIFAVVVLALGGIVLSSTHTIFNPDGSDSMAQDTSGENLDNNESVNLDGNLFIGDSFTFLLKETIAANNPSAVVMAQSGVQPGYWNENFSLLPENSEVNNVVLLIGVNGVTFDNNLPNKKQLIDSLVEKYEGKTIYIQKVFPVGSDFANADPVKFNAAIKNHNADIEAYCQQYDNVVFIDSTEGLVTEDGYLKYTYDGLHINPENQADFYANIEKAVKNVK